MNLQRQRIATPAGVPVVKSEEVRGTGKPACRPRKFPERAKMVGLANKIREPVREEGPGVVGNLAFRRVKKNIRQVNRNRKPDLFAGRVIVRVTSTTTTILVLLLSLSSLALVLVLYLLHLVALCSLVWFGRAS